MSESSSSVDAEHLRKLRWQCRRGIKEVEVLLLPFFEERFTHLSAEDQRLFEKLLEQHDVDMFEWFTHRTVPEQADIARIVSIILHRQPS